MSDHWTTFTCENPDLFVKALPDNVIYPAKRSAMQKSEVFRDMFSIGAEGTSTSDQVVDLHEPIDVLIILLRLLHYPIEPPTLLPDTLLLNSYANRLPKKHCDPSTVIPLPLLTSVLYVLADKYVLDDSITECMDKHLAAHAHTDPLTVYGFATSTGKHTIASEASQYVMLAASFRSEEIQKIPTVEAYHKLVRLQSQRLKALRALVLGEDIFPHGYGTCPTHKRETEALWNAKRNALALEVDIQTDVAGEMDTISTSLPQNCEVCRKACTAAVQMLQYKFRRVIKRIDQLPPEA